MSPGRLRLRPADLGKAGCLLAPPLRPPRLSPAQKGHPPEPLNHTRHQGLPAPCRRHDPLPDDRVKGACSAATRALRAPLTRPPARQNRQLSGNRERTQASPDHGDHDRETQKSDACDHRQMQVRRFSALLSGDLRAVDRPRQSRLRRSNSRIFMHRRARCKRPQLPPTGSSWIAVVRWRPRPSCLPHGDRPPGGGADRGSRRRGVNGGPAGGRPDAAGLGDRVPGMVGLPAGCLRTRAIRGRKADASPESSGRPGFRPAAGTP